MQVGAQTVASGDIVGIVGDVVEERLKNVMKSLGLPSREDYARLLARVEKLESEAHAETPKSPARRRAAAAAKTKALPAKTAPKTALAKVAAKKAAVTPKRRATKS